MATLKEALDLQLTAGKLATRMAASETLVEHVDDAIRVANENKITVNNIHFDLFGTPNEPDAGIFKPEDYDNLPEVGSEEGKTGNKPFDYFEYKDSGGTNQKAYFWRHVALRFPVGAAIQAKLDAISNREKVANEYTNMEKAAVERIKRDLTADFNTFYSKLRLAVQCFHMMKKVAEELEGVVAVDYAQVPRIDPKTKKAVKDSDGAVVYDLDLSSPQIIEVKDATDPKNPARKFFTIANFVRLNVELTLAGEGNYAAFITSNKRGENDNENPDETKHIKINNEKDFEDGTLAVLQFINGAKKDKVLWRKLVAYYTKDAPQDRLETLANARDAISLLMEVEGVKKELEAIEIAGRKAA